MEPPRTVYEMRDPAPASEGDMQAAAQTLADAAATLFTRFRAIVAVRNHGGAHAVAALGRALAEDASPLLRHEVAYVFGQMGDSAAVPHVERAARYDPHPMVRHEAVEALGKIVDADVDGLLRRIHERDEDPEVRDSEALALENRAYLRDPSRFDLDAGVA